MPGPLKFVQGLDAAVDAFSNPCHVNYGMLDQGVAPSPEQCAVDVALAKQKILDSQFMFIPTKAKGLAFVLGLATGIYFAFKG